MMILCIGNTFATPMQLCFNSYFAEVNGLWVYLDAMADVFFVFDLILKYVDLIMMIENSCAECHL